MLNMSNKKKIKQLIKEQIKLKTPKSEIIKLLDLEFQPKEYYRILNEIPDPLLKEKYKKLNGILIAALILFYFLRALSAFGSLSVSSPELVAQLGNLTFIILILSLILPSLIICYLFTMKASSYTLYVGFFGLKDFAQCLDLITNAFKSNVLLEIILSRLITAYVCVILFLAIFLFRKVHPEFSYFPKINK